MWQYLLFLLKESSCIIPGNALNVVDIQALTNIEISFLN